MRVRTAALWLGAAALVLVAAGAFAFQDAIYRFWIAPKTPFQVTRPPPAPQYGARGAWALWPDKDLRAGAADIFYVHSTTYYSAKDWNAPVAVGAAEAELKARALPNEAGPFLNLGAVYAPRYRQATLYALFTQGFDGVAARLLAYEDVKRAFRLFLRSTDGKRPIVLVGYGQGGLYAQGLLKDHFAADDALRSRLAVAYVIGQATPLSSFDDALRETPPCARPTDVRCIVSYSDFEPRDDEEMSQLRERSMVFSSDGELTSTAGEPLFCVNPLTFTPTQAHVAADRHKGAASATGLKFGAPPPPVPGAVGAQCIDGVLVVDRPRQEYLRRGRFLGARWRARHYNLFYFDLAADAQRRADVLAEKLAKEAMILDPIARSVDVKPSPVNKIPPP
jgi:hypothetical protein